MSSYTLADVSFVLPSRTNLRYLKWCYEGIRKNLGPDIQICMADDASLDQTWEWMVETRKNDPNVKAIRNPGPKRLGHTILYDRIVNELVTTPLAIIAHADMYWAPGAVDAMMKLMGPKMIVSATRIEPPLHPPGPEKVVRAFGTEPEHFNETEFLKFHKKHQADNVNKTTKGVFAPWMFNVEDFKAIGGHDPLFAPQSKEDSDIWNRLLLYGCDFVQTWGAYVYHMTCRGSRYNPTLTKVGTESPEWLAQNQRSTRNFIRKWGHFVKHDQYIYPIVPPKYDVGFVVRNCTYQMLHALEPWCSTIYTDADETLIDTYIDAEQKNTKIMLRDRIKPLGYVPDNNVVLEFNADYLTPTSFEIITNLSEIIQDTDDLGEFTYDIYNVKIKSLQTFEKDLVDLNSLVTH